MTATDFLPESQHPLPEKGTIGYKAPSNIALIKYWGKYGQQLPKNPSISFTLDHCATTTLLHFNKRTTEKKGLFDFEVYLDGKRKITFEPKIEAFLGRIDKYVPFIKEYSFHLETSNSFPHSSGIASSASGMAALALCLMDMERMGNSEMTLEHFIKKASFLARLGSGSAARSIEGPMVVWGGHENIEGSSDLFGTPYTDSIHSVFSSYQDTILLVDKGEKQVSSTVGHNLMNGHPYAASRFEQASLQMDAIKPILAGGDLEAFNHLVEREALTLHAMMMTSSPYFMLMKPNTLKIIEHIWEFRRSTSIPVCFTLDAGANVHVLYPEADSPEVVGFVKEELAGFCQEGQFIKDRVGMGAQKSP